MRKITDPSAAVREAFAVLRDERIPLAERVEVAGAWLYVGGHEVEAATLREVALLLGRAPAAMRERVRH